MKIANKTLLLIISLYLAFIILENAALLSSVTRKQYAEDITSRVFGEVRLCSNHPPILDYPCAAIVRESHNFYCAVNMTDEDNNSVESWIDFISGPYFFNISPGGVINFTPNASQVGNYSYTISAFDSSGCENHQASISANLTVTDINTPPVLLSPIPNQTWQQDTSITPFDLDSYFYDFDGDALTYTYTLIDDIDVTIDANNIVTFTPLAGISGTRYIYKISEILL